MAIRVGNRAQLQMLPACIEEYVPEDAPVRVYDAFVDSLDLGELGIEYRPEKEGNPSYDPRAMLKLLVYGYSYGVRSSRLLEREVNYNLSFIWLMGGLKPDFKTISEFRRNNKEGLRKALRACVRLCLKLDLVAGNILFVDGSKMRANASIKNCWSIKKAEKTMARMDKKIDKLISEAEALDKAEESQPSLVKVSEELRDVQVRKERVKEILEELNRDGVKSLNTVDRDCVVVHGRQGSHAGYNAQVVVDDEHGLIVSGDIAEMSNNDLGQFTSQIQKANEAMGRKCSMGVADSGYAGIDDLAKAVGDRIKVIVPSMRIASKKEPREFDKRNFAYDAERDCYTCPRGHTLIRNGRTHAGNGDRYRITDRKLCFECANYGKCTRARRGRTLERLDAEILREQLEKVYALSENQAIYKRRQEKVELIFGHIKKNLGVSSFLLRGLEGARAEISLLSICFNLRRMMTLLGATRLIKKLREKAIPEKWFCLLFGHQIAFRILIMAGGVSPNRALSS
jgi:transposase